MCTVTVLPGRRLSPGVPVGDRLLLRVACNRDELATRAAALPPSHWTAGARKVVMPIDPQSGGTWIAANDAGLVFVLLNGNPGAASAGQTSRGTIIPALVGASTVSEALERALDVRADEHQPFKLLLVDEHQFVECWPDEGSLRSRTSFLQKAVMRTSSGLGDAVVVGPRRTLFRQIFRNPADEREAQDRFHRHQWPGREPISVLMDRDVARTVSWTVVEVTERTVRMTYRPTDSPSSVSERRLRRLSRLDVPAASS